MTKERGGDGQNSASGRVSNGSSYLDGVIPAGVISDKIVTPDSGVKLNGGIVKTTFDNNVQYLLKAFSVNDILYRFKERAGDANPPGQPQGWEATCLPGSLAGLFLMGSGGVLRWENNAELRDKMNRVIDGIDECKQPNGYIMAYKETEITNSENPNYVRSWITHGLIEASIAGNPKALPLIREHQNWFNECPYLPRVKDLHLGYQGMIANTRMYFTSRGRQRDIDVVQQYYQEDWWLDQLIENDDKAIYLRRKGNVPYKGKGPFPHCYEITTFEAYLDMYRATGIRRYLYAMNNAWNMLHDKWEHVGGSWALCEYFKYPPKYPYPYVPRSYITTTGELCCSVFWIKFNQRYHRFYPDDEKYVNEIEKSIYNVGIANQTSSTGIRYHAILHKQKSEPTREVSCCEGQGTRLYGSLPEYLYSIAPDGLYVDIYSSSRIIWNHRGTDITLTNSTSFPEGENVELSISVSRPAFFNLRLRIPSWVVSDVEIHVNGSLTARGKAGTYCLIARQWKDDDTISFALPMDFRVAKLIGSDVIKGWDRYAILYGPILLGVVGSFDYNNCIKIMNDPENPASWLVPVPGKPLHFYIKNKPGYEYIPYYQIQRERFTCYPIIKKKE